MMLSPSLSVKVTRKYGVAALKQAMEWFGYHGGATRSPLQPLLHTELQQLRMDFSSNGWLWLDRNGRISALTAIWVVPNRTEPFKHTVNITELRNIIKVKVISLTTLDIHIYPNLNSLNYISWWKVNNQTEHNDSDWKIVRRPFDIKYICVEVKCLVKMTHVNKAICYIVYVIYIYICVNISCPRTWDTI